ncbi:MAG: hypothetical protein K9L86_07175 [Candidatus Omnitrophica bacterium]|nr:hypothetical protein [Candidatus Omnitrophota bacterium]
MFRAIPVIIMILLVVGCGLADKEHPVITIGNIEVSKQEFKQALNSSLSRSSDVESQRDFLDQFISRKLILNEAERLGLDKDPEFLKDVQLFWEQSLLKLALSKKIKELAVGIQVNDQDIRRYYKKNKDSQFPEKELAQVYDQIKWVILNEKQREAINQWAESLKTKVKINIDYEGLDLKANQ